MIFAKVCTSHICELRHWRAGSTKICNTSKGFFYTKANTQKMFRFYFSSLGKAYNSCNLVSSSHIFINLYVLKPILINQLPSVTKLIFYIDKIYNSITMPSVVTWVFSFIKLLYLCSVKKILQCEIHIKKLLYKCWKITSRMYFNIST